jgi:hypothetical protein
MELLTEIPSVRQITGEPHRRWFRSASLDLIVWCNAAREPIGFQLCYDKPRDEHALTWTPEFGFLHAAIDDGESVGLNYKQSPMLVADGHVDIDRICGVFNDASANMPKDIVEFVGTKLRQYAARPSRA